MDPFQKCLDDPKELLVFGYTPGSGGDAHPLYWDMRITHRKKSSAPWLRAVDALGIRKDLELCLERRADGLKRGLGKRKHPDGCLHHGGHADSDESCGSSLKLGDGSFAHRPVSSRPVCPPSEDTSVALTSHVEGGKYSSRRRYSGMVDTAHFDSYHENGTEDLLTDSEDSTMDLKQAVQEMRRVRNPSWRSRS